MYKKVALLASLTFVSQFAQADSVIGLVSSIGCHNTEDSCWIQVQGAPNSQYCNNSSQLRWKTDTAYGARLYATFLAAHLAGKRVNIELSSTMCGPQGYPTVSYGSVID